MRFIIGFLLCLLPFYGMTQTVCAYETEGEIYIITYKRAVMATLEPNPSDGFIVIKLFNIRPSDRYSVSIYDAFRLISFNVLGEETPIDCTGLAPGVYNYMIRNHGNIVKSDKFVIQ